MARSPRSLPALGALLLCCGVVAGCGNGVPGDSIAQVGNAKITKAQFNHWLVIAQRSVLAQTTPGAAAPPLDSPDFNACVAYHQKNDPKPPKGTPNPTPASLKTLCQSAYTSALDEAVPFLITADWLQGEAADQGIKVTDAEVATQLKTIESQMFKTPGALQQFLANSGETNADLLYRVRIEAVRNKLMTKAENVKVAITPAQVASFYNKNASQFARPETRDLRIVLVKSAGLAAHVRGLIQHGQSIAAVARKFSVDPATKAQGGVLIGVKPGDEEAPLNTAIFGAKVGQLVGPVKTSFGYEVFRLQRIAPASKSTLAQVTPAIRQQLTTQAQNTALSSFGMRFTAKWTARTSCAKAYIVPQCKNAPKTKTTSTGSSATSTTPSQ